jgi:CubicO group peptidase (beta-lactamase class C family)
LGVSIYYNIVSKRGETEEMVMMSRVVHICAEVLVLLLLISCSDEENGGNGNHESESDSDTDSDTASWDPRFDDFVDALKADLENSEAYGVSAAVMEDGEITFAAAFGSKDEEGNDPLTPNTLMQIGSTTKQMTAVALLRKVDEGLLSVDDTLEDLLPLFEFERDSSWDDQVTVHHLLSQQSGIVDWTPWDGPSEDSELATYTYDEFDDEQYLMNPPGAFFNYSNPNYVLTGLLTESLDSRSWTDIMKEDIFLPLGMDRTFLRKEDVEADGDYALSYGFASNMSEQETMGAVSMEDLVDSAWIRPAGLVWTTPSQMMTWAKFIMKGDEEVLSDDLREEMATPHVEIFPGIDAMSYGYGLFIEKGYATGTGEWYETPVLQHGGNTLSFTHLFYMLPEYDFAVAICSSTYADSFARSLSTAITTIVDLPEPSEVPVDEVNPKQFDNHVGVYNDPWMLEGQVIVTREDDALYVEIPTLESSGYDVNSELVPVTSDIFLLGIDDDVYELTFISETEGGISTYIRNRSMVATRVEEASENARRSMPQVTDIYSISQPVSLPPSIRNATLVPRDLSLHEQLANHPFR